MPEVLLRHRVVERIGVIVNPGKGVGIYVDHFLAHINRAVGQTLRAVRQPGIAVVVFSVFVKFFLCGSMQVNPVINVVELAGVNFFAAEIALKVGQIHLLECLTNVLILAVPLYGSFPVQVRRVELLAGFRIFRNQVFIWLHFAQQGAGDGVAYIPDKFPVLIICDFGLIHKKGRNRNGLGLVEGTVGNIFTAGSHGEAPLRNKHHTIRIGLEKWLRFLAGTHKLSLV